MKGYATIWFVLGQKQSIAWVVNDERSGQHFGTTNRSEARGFLTEMAEKYPENIYTIQGVQALIDSDELV